MTLMVTGWAELFCLCPTPGAGWALHRGCCGLQKTRAFVLSHSSAAWLS